MKIGTAAGAVPIRCYTASGKDREYYLDMLQRLALNHIGVGIAQAA